MYGANVMDGKFKTFTVQELIQSRKQQLKERFYAEVPYGVQCVEHFNLGTHEVIVAGLADGTIQVLEYTKNKDKESL